MSKILDEAIKNAGGLATSESCPAVLPVDQLNEIFESLAFLSNCFHEIMEDANPELGGAIVLTRSPEFSCRVIRTEGDQSAILVPLGMLARARVLALLLLRYWGRERRINILRSPLDNVPWDDKACPQLLRPLFSEDYDSTWEDLYDLDKTIDDDQRHEIDARELVHLSLVYLVSHEFTHVLHGHFELVDRSRKEDIGMSQNDLYRGLEIDADDGAAALAMLILKKGADVAESLGQPVNIATAWLRLSYTVTMLLSMFDAHVKYIGAYDEGRYNHPLVRREIFTMAASRGLRASEAIKHIWEENEREGWMRCYWALNDLNMDCLRGDFGEMPEGHVPAPLQPLIYGVTNAFMGTLRERIDESLMLMQRVRELLPLFR